MELSFATKALRMKCLDQGRAEKAYGPDVATELRARLADLDAAVTAADLPPSVRLRTSERQLRVSLASEWQLVCEPGGTERPGASLDWARIYRLKLVRIEKR